MSIVSEKITGFEEAQQASLKDTDLFVIAKDTSPNTTPLYLHNKKLSLHNLVDYIKSKITIPTVPSISIAPINITNGLKICTITLNGTSNDIYAPAATTTTVSPTVDTNAILKECYPVGSIYISTTSACPLQGKGGMQWESVGTGRCLWGAAEGLEAGKPLEAGLPNITGLFNGICEPTIINNGCFRATASTKGAEHGKKNVGVSFDASRCNSIYGKSTTVQPPAYLVYFFRRKE